VKCASTPTRREDRVIVAVALLTVSVARANRDRFVREIAVFSRYDRLQKDLMKRPFGEVAEWKPAGGSGAAASR
jgi:hypothetical protein